MLLKKWVLDVSVPIWGRKKDVSGIEIKLERDKCKMWQMEKRCNN